MACAETQAEQPLLQQLFEGAMASRLTCGTCNSTTEAEQPLWVLTLPLADMPDMAEAPAHSRSLQRSSTSKHGSRKDASDFAKAPSKSADGRSSSAEEGRPERPQRSGSDIEPAGSKAGSKGSRAESKDDKKISKKEQKAAEKAEKRAQRQQRKKERQQRATAADNDELSDGALSGAAPSVARVHEAVQGNDHGYWVPACLSALQSCALVLCISACTCAQKKKASKLLHQSIVQSLLTRNIASVLAPSHQHWI